MQTLERDDAVILQPESDARASVVWLHGLGADGYDFLPVVSELGVDDLGVRFVFPHAPVRAVTINGGQRMRAWYDILSLTRADLQDAAGIRESEGIVHNYLRIERERGIPSQRLVLAGFSQGGAIALHTALRLSDPLAGIIALSTYLPLGDRITSEMRPAATRAPILMCHGTADPVLPVGLGTQSRDALRAAGCDVEWHDYPMDHAVCLDELREIGRWLRLRLTAPAAGAAAV